MRLDKIITFKDQAMFHVSVRENQKVSRKICQISLFVYINNKRDVK